ncbi:MAG: D-alanyl-D-alanine carboxypeptidase family protein [Ruminococcus sp.]|nr:D-alanyl-D-alanine carboxypeptidase family protein [Ruminococcus sp.]
MRKKHIRWGKLISAMFGVSFIIFCTDGLRRFVSRDKTSEKITEIGTFLHTGEIPDGKNEETNKNTAAGSGYKTEILTSDKLSQGYLALSNAVNPPSAVSLQYFVNLYDNKNEFYDVMDNTAILNREAAAALNRLMADYAAATSLTNFIVCGTTGTYTAEDWAIPRSCPDSAAGNSVDLAIKYNGEIIQYDGLDSESWIIRNCHHYGYIVRYPEGKEDITGVEYAPWHLTYVGQPHASAIKEFNMCLEEYVSAIGRLDKSQFVYDVGIDKYEVYYVPTFGDSTEIRVPENRDYDVSGDNFGGFIITAKK